MAERRHDDVPIVPLAWLFLAAGVLGVIAATAPHDPVTRVPVVLGISALAIAVSGVLYLLRRRRLHVVGAVVLLTLAIAMTATGIWATGGPPNATSAFYMWICLFAAYVLPGRLAIGAALVCSASYVAVTVISPPSYPPVAHLATSIASLVGATMLVTTLRARLQEVMEVLSEAASTDPLTGLANRRQFNGVLARELARAQRDKRPVSLIVLDLDHFKTVNDSAGHDAGDEVLRLVAAVLTEHSRTVDLPARLGGEEFALILPDTDAEGGVLVAERLRLEVQRRTKRGGPGVTVSLGVACSPSGGRDADALVQDADSALYVAKNGGRDRVECAGARLEMLTA
ncbi:MAG: GGDEF domain-containing protein [Solirubrobacteraceae bacterium]|jgi:diguanylate cyclase (GGDEF)-like protein|nr:GGDEF domain-containing protein [Solirubrobacteraceae bacterium]